MSAPVLAAIIAGGKASRMGERPKGLLERGGQSLLERLIALAGSLAP
ncbi:MAG: NTP transferase domain-containing protein, partial [bacterium]|nr:NTP transferase domain-containing protein [bacterium]